MFPHCLHYLHDPQSHQHQLFPAPEFSTNFRYLPYYYYYTNYIYYVYKHKYWNTRKMHEKHFYQCLGKVLPVTLDTTGPAELRNKNYLTLSRRRRHSKLTFLLELELDLNRNFFWLLFSLGLWWWSSLLITYRTGIFRFMKTLITLLFFNKREAACSPAICYLLLELY